MKKFTLGFALFFVVGVNAQNIGIGTATPSARLHLKGNADYQPVSYRCTQYAS